MKKSQINESNITKFNKNKTITKEEKQLILKELIDKMNSESKFKFWIKTLLSSYSIFPEIIKTVDKIIELQASTVSFVQDIYNGDNSFDQMERVIDLSERKNSLVNIYLMTKDMMSGISKDDYDIIDKRFNLNWSASEIAKDYNISVRTAYRKIDKIVDEIYLICKGRNWSLRLIESQIKNETWLVDRYLKIIKEYLRNANYSPNGNDLKVF